MLQQLINLLRRRPRRAAPPPAIDQRRRGPYFSFRLEGMIRAVTVVWVLDRELRERSKYLVYRN